jgi:predicted ATP-dependent endonuclease of OLD family
MHLKTVSVRNFRRLRNAVIDLAGDISLFVGANNSGKTSVAQALQLFTGDGSFSVHDFNVDLWPPMVAFGEGQDDSSLPTMEIDLWFEVGAEDIHRVVDLLPSLTWQGSRVGMRVTFEPIDAEATRARYQEARQCALAAVAQAQSDDGKFDPSPRDLYDYLSLRGRLKDNYRLNHYLLDPEHFDDDMIPKNGYQPVSFTQGGRGGRDVLKSLLKIDYLDAQRHLSDTQDSTRAEDLSRVLSRFYQRNLDQQGEDLGALHALSKSQVSLNTHLERVFAPTLSSLANLGYPGLGGNPHLKIRSTLNPAHIMSSRDGARVHYALGPNASAVDAPTLPDRYNGLGYKNLIFMVVQLLDFHAQWLAIEEDRPPIHLMFIEEPEAHLHAQLQQVFIRKVVEILQLSDEERIHCTSQIVVTTHSPHILYERGFRPIRYFRRSRTEHASTSDVLSLSSFYDSTDPSDRNFLERYLKLTHCDLFFADAAILVEGNVERILLPLMIKNAASDLESNYLTVLEVGGAFAYVFKDLVNFLDLTTLIITDLDSVCPAAIAEGDPEKNEEEEGDNEGEEKKTEKVKSACIANHPGAETSNKTLRTWLPKCDTVSDLWAATDAQKTQQREQGKQAWVRVAYQCPVDVTWRKETQQLAGRTLEEAFALENLPWCQDKSRKELKLSFPKAEKLDLSQLAEKTHKRVQSKSFKKTDFALALLIEDPEQWSVPAYIADGLLWLQDQLAPPKSQPNGAKTKEAAR